MSTTEETPATPAPAVIEVPNDGFPVLGYWHIRGLAHPIRLLLAFVRMPFHDRRYHVLKGDNPRSEWLAEKHNLGLDFPNLPFYIDPITNVRITQSLGITRHIAELTGLAGQDPAETAKILMLEGHLVDFRQAYVPSVIYTKDNFEQARDAFFSGEKAQSFFSTTEVWLAKTALEGPFLLGARPSYVDFMLWCYLDDIRLLAPETFEKFPNLARHHAAVAGLPGVAEFLASPQHLETPRHPVFASWGTESEMPPAQETPAAEAAPAAAN